MTTLVLRPRPALVVELNHRPPSKPCGALEHETACFEPRAFVQRPRAGLCSNTLTISRRNIFFDNSTPGLARRLCFVFYILRKAAIKWADKGVGGQLGHWRDGETCFFRRRTALWHGRWYSTAHEGCYDWGFTEETGSSRRRGVPKTPHCRRGDVARCVSTQLRIECRAPSRAKVRLSFFLSLPFHYSVRVSLSLFLSNHHSFSFMSLGTENQRKLGLGGTGNCG